MTVIEEIRNLTEEYVRWLKDKTVLRQVNKEWVEIMTPYLDRHNDYLQIYAKREDDGYLLTDDGYTLNDLINSGCPLDTHRRKELLKITLAGFGIQLQSEHLYVHASSENFASRKHNLIQAMLSVNDLFYTAAPIVSSLFFEDVVRWMDLSDIRYTPKVKFTGKSGYDHMFDFVIPKSRHQPERLIQSVNHPNKMAAESLVFKWFDTRETRPSDSQVFALLNDTSGDVSSSVIDALQNYDLKTLLWSKKDEFRDQLAA